MAFQHVLNFWFREIKPEMHFVKDEKFDAEIREKFHFVYNDICTGKTESWRSSPQGRLAEVIVLDQFARNMFRDTPQAFAADPLALKLAIEAIRVGADQELSPEERGFIYMPFMHSEDRKVHKQAVQLFSQPGFERQLKYELMHKKIIDRFGRYPHRNKILNRDSTSEEIEFLKEKNSSF